MVYLKSFYPPVPQIPEMNFHNLLFKRPDQATWPDYVVYINPTTSFTLTYRQFLERVYDGATALGTPAADGGRFGLRGENGNVVGIISENSSDYMALVHSLLAITTPFALMSSYSTPYELAHALRLAKPTHLFVSAKVLKRVLPVAKEFGLSLDAIFVLGQHRFDSEKHLASFGDLVAEVRNTKDMPRISVREAKKDTIAYLVFSSGTSGLPKAVCLSHGNLIYSAGQSMVIAMAAAAVEPPPPGFNPQIALGFLPMSHSYGLHAYCFRTFLRPATLIMLPTWDINVALSSIAKYRITSLSLIPSVVHQLVNHPGIKEADMSSVESVTCGAAYLSHELAQKLADLMPGKIQMTEGYGMSEATIGAIMQPPPGSLGGRAKRVPGSCGFLIPGMEARILRPDGSHANIGEAGELYLRSENIALGYWGNDKATQEAFVDLEEDKGLGGKWLKTGDMFRVDDEGYFYFADRSKDTLKISGAQVSPVEIEEAVMEEPSKLIIDITVAGVSGGRTSDEKVPKAWIVLSQLGREKGVENVVNTLNAWVNTRLSKYKALRGGIEVVDEIPKLPTGKVLRRLLQEKHEESVRKNREDKTRSRL